jgi:hypothetical protein
MIKFSADETIHPLYFSLDRLLENTFDIENDSILLFNKYLKSIIQQIQSKKINNSIYDKLKKGEDYLIVKTDSSIFKTDDCKKAHSIKPVDIYIGIFKDYGMSYSHDKNSDDIIIIGLNFLDLKNLYSLDFSSSPLYRKQVDTMLKNMTANRILASINHEISHWISNNFYNRHITNKRDLPSDLSDKEKETILKVKDVNISYFEIDAQVHAIKMIKKRLIDKVGKIEGESIWNTFTLDDVALDYHTITSIYNMVLKNYGEPICKLWLKALLKRLDREKLLGNNMSKFENKHYMYY